MPDLHRIARDHFGIERFRPGQREAMAALLRGNDVLAVMPSGYGKSALYQVPAVALPGPTVVISPLIALQRDQARTLRGPEAGGAAVVNSALGTGERAARFDELTEGALEFLFLAPEQLRREDVLARLRRARPSLWVVDEAHCISEWGHDFRPDYLDIGRVVDDLGHPPVLALTATASPRVREEIVERLHMRHAQVLVRGFDRPNIHLAVRRFDNGERKRAALMAALDDASGSGIVYVATRRSAEEIAGALVARGRRAGAYHGGMRKGWREATQAGFMDDELEVIVATSAFGMGIDKPDVRHIVHYEVSDSLDAYYQEVGRAGRDGLPARALLLFQPSDLNLRRFFAGGQGVRAEELEAIGNALLAAGGALQEAALAESVAFGTRKLARALHRLEDQGFLERPAGGAVQAREPTPRALGQAIDAAVQAERRRHEEASLRIERMRAYAEVRSCRRQYLLGYFGEEIAPCGTCDNCERGLPAAPSSSRRPFALRTRILHRSLGGGVVEGYDGEHVVILFDEHARKRIDLAFAVGHGLLRKA